MHCVTRSHPILFFSVVSVLCFISLVSFELLNRLDEQSFSLTDEDLSENEKAVEVVETIDSKKSFISKTDEVYNLGDVDVYGVDDISQADDIKSTQPSPKDPLREDAPAAPIPTQPMNQDQDYSQIDLSEDAARDTREYVAIQIVPQKNLICMHMALAGAIVAGIILLLASFLHTLVEWITEEDDEKPINPKIFDTTAFVAKLNSEKAKTIMFSRTPQIHKV